MYTHVCIYVYIYMYMYVYSTNNRYTLYIILLRCIHLYNYPIPHCVSHKSEKGEALLRGVGTERHTLNML